MAILGGFRSNKGRLRLRKQQPPCRLFWHPGEDDFRLRQGKIHREDDIIAIYQSIDVIGAFFVTPHLLSWIGRRGPPPLARAARIALKAKGVSESFTSIFDPADRALERLDALLPAAEPLAALAEWIRQLREDETPFLEGGSEFVEFEGHVFSRFAPRGAAWAASLAAGLRPQLFGLGAAPLALAGLAPRSLFKEVLESPLPSLLSTAISSAAAAVSSDLSAMRQALNRRDLELRGLYASSHAPHAWQLISALGPLTRAELARALDVTPRTASQAVVALGSANLVRLRPADKVILSACG